jgi:hypothetical protein
VDLTVESLATHRHEVPRLVLDRVWNEFANRAVTLYEPVMDGRSELKVTSTPVPLARGGPSVATELDPPFHRARSDRFD